MSSAGAVELRSPTSTARGRRARRDLRGDLRASTIDGTAFSVMVGVGDSYLALFVLAAGLGSAMSGLVLTIPALAAAVLQLFSLSGARAVGSLRRWTVLSAIVQASAWAPLVGMAWTGLTPWWLVMLAVVLYHTGGQCAGVTWTTWIGQLVPARIRPRYFARRAWPCHIGTMVGLVAGGLILELAARGSASGEGGHALDAALPWFGLLFALALVSRGISAYYLWRCHETGPVTDEHVHVHPIETTRRLLGGPDGRLIGFMVMMMGAANIANPFFAAYARDELGFSYVQIMALLATALVSRAFAQVAWGEFAHRHGPGRLLLIAAALFVPISGLWLVSGSFWWMLAAQAVAGAAWGAYELSTLLLTLRVVKEHERTSLWAQFNVLNTLTSAGGSLVGAAILQGWLLPESWVGAFGAVFLLSMAARLAVVAWLLRARQLLAIGPGNGFEEADRIQQARGDHA